MSFILPTEGFSDALKALKCARSVFKVSTPIKSLIKLKMLYKNCTVL